MTGIERLKNLSENSKIPGLLKVIDYLATRKDMYEKYLNEEKTPDQLWQYIRNKAKTLQEDDCVFLDDKIVYAWAISYFLFSNEHLGIKKQQEKEQKPKKQASKKIVNIETIKEKEKSNTSQISLFETRRCYIR